MPDFLTNIVTTHLKQRRVIEPRRPFRFEPAPTSGMPPAFNAVQEMGDSVDAVTMPHDEATFNPIERTISPIIAPVESDNNDERPSDLAETPRNVPPDAGSFLGQRSDVPTLTDQSAPLALESPFGDASRSALPLSDSLFARQGRPEPPLPTPSEATPQRLDPVSQPRLDLGADDAEMTLPEVAREGLAVSPSLDDTESTPTQPTASPRHDHPQAVVESIAALPSITPPPPIYQQQPPTQGTLEPHPAASPAKVGSLTQSFADALEIDQATNQPSRPNVGQIVPSQDQPAQSSISPTADVAASTLPPALVPATSVQSPATEPLITNVTERQTNAPPTIKVTIGRIEVRAEIGPPPVQPAPPARQRYQPRLSLADYLQKRNEGRR